MRWSAPGVTFITSIEVRERLSKKHWKQLAATNFIGSVWFFFYVTFAISYIGKSVSGFGIESIDPSIVFVCAGPSVGTAAVSIYGAATAWGNRFSVTRVLSAIFFGLFFLVFVYPNGNNLLGSFLRALSLGGGKWVVLTAEASLSKEWPEIFDQPKGGSEDNGEDVSRTKPIRLALLGKNRVFVYAPTPGAGKGLPEGSPIMFERSVVKSIAFINERDN
jgi:hypothetical protein